MENMDMADTNVSSGKMPDTSGLSGSSSPDVHPSVAEHDHVMHVQNGN